MRVRVEQADLDDPSHAEAVRSLVDGYARDPMGGAQPLPAEVLAQLVPGLRAHPTTRVWLAFDGDVPAGAAVCFLGFGTFDAKPLLNVHDLIVAEGSRRRGIGRQLLDAVEAGARDLGCCRVTLEVREDNTPARALYRAFGLRGLMLGGSERSVHFLAKDL